MIKFELYKNRKTANIVIDKTNLKEKDARGIRRVAQKVCKDVERVTGVCPVIGKVFAARKMKSWWQFLEKPRIRMERLQRSL